MWRSSAAGMHASALLRRYVSADNGLRQLRLFLDAHGWPSASDLQQVCVRCNEGAAALGV